jgi:hypothetical protein
MFVLMDIMIQQQYAQHPTALREFGRLLGTLPCAFGPLLFVP